MKTETTVTRFVLRKDLVTPYNTLKKANEEAKDYVWQRAGNGHYVCKHGDTAHIIIEKDETIGCSCGDWTHRCKGVECCKHVSAFLDLRNPPAAKLDRRIVMDLIAAGWGQTQHGNLYPIDQEGADAAQEKEVNTAMGATWQKEHPEGDQIPPDPDLDIGVGDPLPEPEPEPKQVSVTCQYCKMSAMRAGQAKADAWLREHESKCAKNPENLPDVGLITAVCRWCGEKFEHTNAVELHKIIKNHEAICPKRPKGGDTTQEEKKMSEDKPEQKSTALSTGHDMPDEREFTNQKVRNYVENRGGFYKAAGGKEVPDSAAMSIYALDTCRISTETILIEKNADQAKAIVRGHKGGVSVDASVILRFDVLRRRELLKMAKKYSAAIIGWSEDMMPILDLNFMLKDRTPMINLGEHMINFAIDQEQFADRTAETLARRRAFDMLTGVDWRDAAEVAVEDADAASMGNKKD